MYKNVCKYLPDKKQEETIMIGFIIWIIGAVLTIKACFEILMLDVALWKRILVAVALLATSWFGLAFYYLIAKGRIEDWLK